MESLLEYRFLKTIYENIISDWEYFYIFNQCLNEAERPPWVPGKKAYIANPSQQAIQRHAADPYKTINTPEGPKKLRRSPPKTGSQGALLHGDDNAKIAKSNKKGYVSLLLNLSPAEESGFNLCACRTSGCALACLHLSGSPVYQKAKMQSRLGNTFYLVKQREKFIDQLISEIELAREYARKENKPLAIRLNGTSDLPWETAAFGKNGKSIFELFPDVQFYDYTKIHGRMKQHSMGKMPENYHLTFSYSEKPGTAKIAMDILKDGGNVAIAFGPGRANVREIVSMPLIWNGYKVIDGDESDLRFNDDKGVVVGLRAKADAAWDYDTLTPESMQAIAQLFAQAGIKQALVATGFSSQAKQAIHSNKQLLFSVIDIFRGNQQSDPKNKGSGFVVQPEDQSVDPRQFPDNYDYVAEGIEKKLSRAFRGRDGRETFRQMRKDYYSQHSTLYQDYLAKIEKYCKEHPDECKDTFNKIPVAQANNPLAQHDIGIQPQKLQQIGLIQRKGN